MKPGTKKSLYTKLLFFLLSQTKSILKDIVQDENSLDVEADNKNSTNSLLTTTTPVNGGVSDGVSVSGGNAGVAGSGGVDPLLRKSDNNLLNLVESSFEFGMFLNSAVTKISTQPSENEAAATSNNSSKSDAHSINNRFKRYPTLSYATLYHALINLIEIVPSLQANQIGSFYPFALVNPDSGYENYFTCG